MNELHVKESLRQELVDLTFSAPPDIQTFARMHTRARIRRGALMSAAGCLIAGAGGFTFSALADPPNTRPAVASPASDPTADTFVLYCVGDKVKTFVGTYTAVEGASTPESAADAMLQDGSDEMVQIKMTTATSALAAFINGNGETTKVAILNMNAESWYVVAIESCAEPST